MLHPLLLPYKPDGTQPPFFCVHGRELLAQYMDVDQPYYALHPHALDGKLAPETVETMAADYIQALQTRQVQGPYFLGGCSFGGVWHLNLKWLINYNERVNKWRSWLWWIHAVLEQQMMRMRDQSQSSLASKA